MGSYYCCCHRWCLVKSIDFSHWTDHIELHHNRDIITAKTRLTDKNRLWNGTNWYWRSTVHVIDGTVRWKFKWTITKRRKEKNTFIFHISVDWLLTFSMILRSTPQTLNRLLPMHFLHNSQQQQVWHKNGMWNHIFQWNCLQLSMTSFFALHITSIMMREAETEMDASYISNQLLFVHSNNGVSMAHDEDGWLWLLHCSICQNQ